MYESFFDLSVCPFATVPDPNFLFPTPQHEEAVTGISYAIRQRKGFVVLTGDAGTGKTTVLVSVLRLLEHSGIQSSWVINPALTATEFLEAVLLDFGIQKIPESKTQRLSELQKILLEAADRNQSSVLIVDEAQQLSTELLEEIRLLSNFEAPSGKLLQIILAGQNEFASTLDRYDLRQLKQRVAVRLQLRPLKGDEVAEYIDHRWNVAGGPPPSPFTPKTNDQIARCSAGIPRVINAICDQALLIAFSETRKEITANDILEVAAEFNLNAAAPYRMDKGQASRTRATSETSVLLRSDPLVELGVVLPTLGRYAKAEGTLPFGMRWAERLGVRTRRTRNHE